MLMESPRSEIVCATRSRPHTSMHSFGCRSPLPALFFSALLAAACLAGLAADPLMVRRTTPQAALLGGQLERFFAIQLGLMHQFLDARRQRLRRVTLPIPLSHIGWAKKECDFAARRPFFERGGNVGELAAPKNGRRAAKSHSFLAHPMWLRGM